MCFYIHSTGCRTGFLYKWSTVFNHYTATELYCTLSLHSSSRQQVARERMNLTRAQQHQRMVEEGVPRWLKRWERTLPEKLRSVVADAACAADPPSRLPASDSTMSELMARVERAETAQRAAEAAQHAAEAAQRVAEAAQRAAEARAAELAAQIERARIAASEPLPADVSLHFDNMQRITSRQSPHSLPTRAASDSAPSAAHEVTPEQHAAATRLQAVRRGSATRAEVAARPEGKLVDAVATQGPPEAAADLEQAADDAVAAATCIQAQLRGKQVRARQLQDETALQELQLEAQAAEEAVQAATRVQASVRGRAVRRRHSAPMLPGTKADNDVAAAAMARESETWELDRSEAATRVQASMRGRQARAKAAGGVVDMVASDVERHAAEVPLNAVQAAKEVATAEVEVAATHVQAVHRGRQARAARRSTLTSTPAPSALTASTSRKTTVAIAMGTDGRHNVSISC